jgi:hypothetical protein
MLEATVTLRATRRFVFWAVVLGFMSVPVPDLDAVLVTKVAACVSTCRVFHAPDGTVYMGGPTVTPETGLALCADSARCVGSYFYCDTGRPVCMVSGGDITLVWCK